MKRLMLAAPMSGSGKTTVATGLIAALTARGLRVAPFKVGPDYIDPSYHTLAAGRPAHNLDTWLVPPEQISASFARRTQNADIAMIEGMMGLFDGFSGTDDTGSAAHIARLLDAPVILILDASAMARSAAAIVRGFRDFDPQVRLAGVILNRVGGAGHAQMVQTAIEEATGVPVVGYLTQDVALHLPERHLGLIPTAEPGRWQAWIEQVRDRVAQTVQLDRLLEIAASAGPLPSAETVDPFARQTASTRARLAIAHDEAFNFVYADNLDLLRADGAELVEFSPLHDVALPANVQGIYLCGGFPELYAAQLAANQALLADLRKAATQGLPIYAECGGLMLLTEAIVDGDGALHQMAGLLRGRSVMTPRLTIGYRTAQAQQTNWLWQAGETMRGHEFHHSVWQDRPANLPFAYTLQADAYRREEPEGVCLGNVLASYLHLHFLAKPELAERFVLAASRCAPWGVG